MRFQVRFLGGLAGAVQEDVFEGGRMLVQREHLETVADQQGVEPGGVRRAAGAQRDDEAVVAIARRLDIGSLKPGEGA